MGVVGGIASFSALVSSADSTEPSGPSKRQFHIVCEAGGDVATHDEQCIHPDPVVHQLTHVCSGYQYLLGWQWLQSFKHMEVSLYVDAACMNDTFADFRASGWNQQLYHPVHALPGHTEPPNDFEALVLGDYFTKLIQIDFISGDSGYQFFLVLEKRIHAAFKSVVNKELTITQMRFIRKLQHLLKDIPSMSDTSVSFAWSPHGFLTIAVGEDIISIQDMDLCFIVFFIFCDAKAGVEDFVNNCRECWKAIKE